MMSRIFFIFVLISFNTCLNAQNESTGLVPDKNFPHWLKSNSSRTDQTSGIAFIKSDCDIKYFLLADDIGVIHLLNLRNDSVFNIDKVQFTEETEKFFSKFPKMDFEEIVYDKNTGEVYLSVEGNGDNYNDYVGIYKLIFKENDVLSKQVISIVRIFYQPGSLFYKYTNNNIGYEGFALDDNYFYLGLEGFQNSYQFADSTVIFIANKTDMKIIKEISTKNLGLHTICGLFSDENYSIWGIDRNNRKIFHIKFDEEFNISTFSKYDCSAAIPGYHDLNYLPSYESITIDEENNLYIVDDPWREMFIPNQNILDELDSETKNNFKEYIPIIFKYKITHPEGDK